MRLKIAEVLTLLFGHLASHLPLCRFNDLTISRWPAIGLLVGVTTFAHTLYADPSRRPADVIAFSGLKPGDKVADFLPNTGDFANELCKVVGDAGHVYVFSMSSTERRGGCSNITAHTLRSRNFPAPELYNASDDPGAVYEYYASRLPVESFVAPEPLDLIWMSGRYHDLHNKSLGSPNILFVTTALLVALKPGGILIIEDHAATETRDAKTLHRITAEQVKKEVVAAGFVFVDESKVLYRADDPHTANAHEMRETDRFVLKFRKPTIGPLS